MPAPPPTSRLAPRSAQRRLRPYNEVKATRVEGSVFAFDPGILWTLNHPDVWQLLVMDRGWTPQEWEQWFAAQAISSLLRSG